jgi:hypothetical protein
MPQALGLSKAPEIWTFEPITPEKSASVYERIASASGRALENRKSTKCA